MINKKLPDHRYQISFPGGNLIYQPLEGLIIDTVKNRSFLIRNKRTFSIIQSKPEREEKSVSDFKPVCLTIYASHQCNMNCTYCYIAGKDAYPDEFIDPVVVKSAAGIVAKNCKDRELPFVVGFHGGNEPLLHPEKLEDYLSICESVADKYKLKLISSCTTNGVISEDTAQWAVKRFSRIALSWDGPPAFHDIYRKDCSNNPTCNKVEKTARIFSDMKKETGGFIIRCTITSLSVDKMPELTGYFYQAGVKIVEFYPVFMNRGQTFSDELIPEQYTFVYHFLKARRYGLARGMKVLFAGSRLHDFHNRYCMILQDNLTVTPDGYLTNCYHHTQNYSNRDNLYFYGRFDESTRVMEFNLPKWNSILKKYETELSVCVNCFNQFHCSHGCPDICPFEDNYNIDIQPDCIKEKWLGLAAVLERTGYLRDFENKEDFFDFFQNISSRRLD
ncbi:MAG: hypothetical protein JW723_15720 [Bacteroidales bacterium]|nr:hypothetical protein [Bacteroidales bacterium]